MKSSTVTIKFSNPSAAAHFVHWLGGQGEQDYCIWMECREQEEEGDITALRFDYDYDNTVEVKAICGRMDARKIKK
jgi:hypothetical protein